jgi:hypothetical protein
LLLGGWWCLVVEDLFLGRNWSTRFESWQAEPPQGLVGPLTPFAVEDLPSQ